MPDNKTAVLFFSRTLNDEFNAKPLGINKPQFSDLYKFFVRKTLHTAKASGLPVIEVYSDQQKGDSFGERLINSIRSVEKMGYESVIVIGNDAPELESEDILSASTQLANQRPVLGKDQNGGVYLIGLCLKGFDPNLLTRIDWHSRQVFDQLYEVLGHVYALCSKQDINVFRDIKSVVRLTTHLSRGAVTFMLSLLVTAFSVFEQTISPELVTNSSCAYRGPPPFNG